MPRIRTIKPEFWADEKLSPLDPVSRLVFLGLISMADDCGRLVDNLKQIDAFIFPETDDSSREALARLSRISRIDRGKTESGQRVIQIVNWEAHQKIDHPNKKAALPPIVEEQGVTGIREEFANDSRGTPETLAPRPTTYDLRPVPAPEEIALPLPDGSECPITELQMKQWRECYPTLDLQQELLQMRAWLLVNKSRRKKDTGRFVVGWLNRALSEPGKPVRPDRRPVDIPSRATVSCDECSDQFPVEHIGRHMAKNPVRQFCSEKCLNEYRGKLVSA
jgi:hypothetical protein